MTNIELHIGDDKLELGIDTIIALTRQANNLGELKDRQTDYTNTFTIPKSKKNQEIFELLDNINSVSDKSYQKLSCKIVRDGIEITQNGIVSIESVKDNYEITIYSGNANFFEEIGDKKIVELTYLDVNTDWNRADIISALGATSGICWPILNRGVFNNFRWADTRSMWPAIFVHNIVEYIFIEAGYNKAGDYLDSDDYKKLILPYLSIKANDTVRGKMAAWRNALLDYFTVTATNEYDFYVNWDSATKYDPYSLIKLKTGLWGFWRYYVPSDGLYRFRIDMRTYITASHQYVYYKLRDRRDNVLDDKTITPGGAGTYDFELEYEGYFYAQDMIYVHIHVPAAADNYQIQINATTKFNTLNVDCEHTAFECEVPCGINLPDITQKEFLKSLAYMHCLLFIADNIKKTIHFIRFSDIIKNKRIAYDWSDKLDLSKEREPELKFKFGKYGQSNYLRYKEDEEVELELGDDFFVFDNKMLPVEKTLITMPFAATESNTCLAGIVCAKIECQEINKGHILDMDDGLTYYSLNGINWLHYTSATEIITVWFFHGDSVGVGARFDQPIITKQPSSRILAVKKVADVGADIRFYEGSYSSYTGEDENINIAYFIHPSYGDISFNKLIDDYYQEFINVMNKPKVLTAYFKLSPIDILQFDFSIPVWIDYYQSYFYVNKIEEYRGEITLVELIKI
jgi:hypothetical protein